MTTPIAGERPTALRRATGFGLLAVLLGFLLALIGAQAASAHAGLLDTTPEDGAVLDQMPQEAVLRFSESVQILEGSLRMFPGDGDPLTLDAQVVDTRLSAALPQDLGDGRYALSYRVVSADGHPISGAIIFTIGDATGAPTPTLETGTPEDTVFAVNALTVVEYHGLLLFAGLVMFRRLVLRIREPATGIGRWLLIAAGIAAVAAALLLIPASALDIMGQPIASITNPSAWLSGVLWPPLITALLVIVGAIPGLLLVTRSAGRVAVRALSVLAAMVALAAPVLVGHTQLIEPRGLMVVADLGHLLAGAFWIGGILGLLLFLAEASPAGDGPRKGTDPLLATDVVLRFSRLAFWSVLVLAVSGITMGVLIVGTFQALVTTGYGLTLLLKLTIVIAVVAVAFWNRRYLVPAILAKPNARLRWRTLQRTLAYEGALLVVVLVITGILANMSPDHEGHESAGGDETTSTSSEITGEAQQLTIDGTFNPGLTGENTFAFTLTYQGEVVEPESVVLKATLPEHDLGPFDVVAQDDPMETGYTAVLDLPVAGEWQIQVIARVSTFAEPIVRVPITIR
ncbi:MAG: hypothetical protein BGO95_10650 [Micrococcales bacterium 73-13]|nr:MAG: hypothetical protein BGO95_10650 [Micrococcales bacterium 73-13]